MLIRVEREEPDGLRRRVWAFSAFMGSGRAAVLRLDEYAPEARPTKRHKWQRSGEGYRHRSHNGHTHHGGMMAPAAEVPFPEDVVAEARAAFVAAIELVGPVDPPERMRA